MEPNLLQKTIITNESVPNEIKDFLHKVTISKVKVSQVENAWEIYFSCTALPSYNLLNNCRKVIAQYLPEVNRIILKPKIINYNSLHSFLEENWNKILSFLTAKYPSAQGWMANSYWQIKEENKLEINLGNQLGIKYLTKHGCIKYLEELLATFIDEKPIISFKFDEKIKPVIMVKEEPLAPGVNPIPIHKEVSNTGEQKAITKTTIGEIILGKKIKGEVKKIIDVIEEEPNVIVCGKPFGVEIKQLKTGRAILLFNLTDLTDSITCKIIKEQNEIEEIATKITSVPGIKVKGTAQIDRFSQELNLMIYDINTYQISTRTDQAPEKELNYISIRK